MESIFAAARELAFTGAYPDIEAATRAIKQTIEDNRIPVTDDGMLDIVDYMDIVHELKTAGPSTEGPAAGGPPS